MDMYLIILLIIIRLKVQILYIDVFFKKLIQLSKSLMIVYIFKLIFHKIAYFISIYFIILYRIFRTYVISFLVSQYLKIEN